MKIISWNINGIRARIKQGFEEAITKIDPDIICLQEFRAQVPQVPKSFLSSYNGYHSIHAKAGYAGTSVFVKKDLPQPVNVWDDYAAGIETGRVCILEFEEWFLISCYSPNSGMNLEKLPRRIEWENGLTAYLKTLTKPVIMCGDLNVAPTIKDAGVRCLAGCSPQERKAFSDKLALGMTDVFRFLHPLEISYTWFSNRSKAKIKGLRLDEFVVSNSWLEKDSFEVNIEHIQEPSLVCGSDHIPILLNINKRNI